MLTKEELLKFWRDEYGGFPSEFTENSSPLATRRHYLPGGEQYPRHRGQYCEALRRLNLILDYILGDGENYVLLAPEWGPNDHDENHIDFKSCQFLWEDWLTDKDELDEGEAPFLLATWYFKELVWQRGSLDTLLRKVMDEDARFLLLNTKKGWLAKPYDGGIDVVAPSKDALLSFQHEFRQFAPFVGEIDDHEVTRASTPEERLLVKTLVNLGASIYLDDHGRVRELAMNSSEVNDGILAKIAQFQKLEYLKLNPWSGDAAPSCLTDKGLEHLVKLRTLKHLSLPIENEPAFFPSITESGRRLVAELMARIDADAVT